MILETTVDGERVLVRYLTVAAVERTHGDWAAYVVDRSDYNERALEDQDGRKSESIEEYAAKHGDKLTREEALRYFRGPQCPRGEYRE